MQYICKGRYYNKIIYSKEIKHYLFLNLKRIKKYSIDFMNKNVFFRKIFLYENNLKVLYNYF